jgi:hypothetical protein
MIRNPTVRGWFWISVGAVFVAAFWFFPKTMGTILGLCYVFGFVIAYFANARAKS